MANISEKQHEEILIAFNLFAIKHDHKMQLDQVGDCLRILGENPTEIDIKNCTSHLKPDELITFPVFLSIYKAIHMTPIHITADDIIFGLRFIDKSNSGLITAYKLKQLLTKCGSNQMTDEEVDLLLENQVDANGNVDYKKLIHMIMDG